MATLDYDVLVIGGGPAGSCAAAFARQRGLAVCIVEKESFPRFRIGESLLPAGNALLRDAGVWSRVEAAGFVRKYGARFCLADGAQEKRVDFSTGYVRGLEQTFQVERSRFDAILLDHAHELGAEVRLRTCVHAVKPAADGSHVVVTLGSAAAGETRAAIPGLTGGAGERCAVRTVTARWVIDAGGRDNLYPSAAKTALDEVSLARRVAIYTHFRGVPREPGPEGGDTIIVRLPEGWFWIIPIDEERTSVGLVTTAAALRAGGGAGEGGPETFFMRAVAASPRLRQALDAAEPAMGFHVTTDYSYFRQELAGARVVLTGDAAGFFDPIFSSGVYLAMWSAQLAVEMIARAHEEERALTLAERRRYTRRVKGHAGVFERLIHAFYDNDSFAVFMTPQPPLDLGRGLTSIVAGHARLTWPLWWRFQGFLLACRLQKRWQLVPRIDAALHGRVEPDAPAGAPREAAVKPVR